MPDPSDFLALINDFGAAPDELPAVERFLARASDPDERDDAILALAVELLGEGTLAGPADETLTRARASLALLAVARVHDDDAPRPAVQHAALRAARALWRTGGLSPESEDAFRDLNDALAEG